MIFGVPPFVQIATRLPLLSLGHNDRLILIVLACAALLAGWGLDDLAARARPAAPPARGRCVAAAVILLVPLVMVAGARATSTGCFPRAAVEGRVGARRAAAASATRPPPTSIRLAPSCCGCARPARRSSLLAAARCAACPRAPFAGLALALVAVDLLRAGMGYNPAIPDEHADQPETGALRYLADRSPERFVGLGDCPQNVAALRLRLQDARGYDLPILERYNRLWRREVSPEYPDLTSTLISLFLQVPRIDERRLRTLRLLGVTDLLVPPKAAGTPPEGLDTPGLTRVYNGPDAQVLRVDGALPRAFVAGAQQTVDGERRGARRGHQPRARPRATWP